MKKKKYLPLYYKWMKTGRMPQKSKFFNGGLCGAGLSDDPLFEVFKESAYGSCYFSYWGYNGEDVDPSMISAYTYEFSPLRQTILLFMAAMNNEL